MPDSPLADTLIEKLPDHPVNDTFVRELTAADSIAGCLPITSAFTPIVTEFIVFGTNHYAAFTYNFQEQAWSTFETGDASPPIELADYEDAIARLHAHRSEYTVPLLAASGIIPTVQL